MQQSQPESSNTQPRKRRGREAEPERSSGESEAARSLPNAGSEPLSRRRRGAPTGNTNALKHGYYAKVFPASRGGNLEQFDFANLEEEIMLVRLALRQVAAFNSEVKTFQEASTLLRMVCLGVGTLNRLLRTRALVKTAPSRFKNYFEFSRWWEAVLAEENPQDEEAADLENEAEPFPKEDPVPVAAPNLTPSPEPQLLSDDDEEDDIPPALDPDGKPINFEDFYDPAHVMRGVKRPEIVATMPGRAKKTKPPKNKEPERSARWYSPPNSHCKELNRIDFLPKTNPSARHRHRSHRRDRAAARSLQ